jgi:uncharacterized repeat protein (TIGR02543 family)
VSYNILTDEFTLTNPTRTGYFFAGWTGTDIDPLVPAMKVTIPTGSFGDRQYTATWTEDPDYRTLTFDANGGQGSVSLRLKPDDEITPPVVSRTWWVFVGWLVYDDNGDLIEYEVGVMPDYDLTLYASWQPVNNVITFDMNGVGVLPSEIPADVNCWKDYPAVLPSRIFSIDGEYALVGWNTISNGTGIPYERGDLVYPLTTTDGARVTLYAQWKKSGEFGVFDAMYMFTGQVFGLREDGTVTDTVYDASVSGEKPVLDYPYMPPPAMHFKVKKTGDSDNPVALYLYASEDLSWAGSAGDFSGYPLVQFAEDPYPYVAPEGSLIGSGNNDGLTTQCKQRLQERYGSDWAKGLVTVGNITMLWKDSRYDEDDLDYNVGLVFESVNGVKYFFSGRTSCSYGMEYQYEALEFGYTVIDSDPTPAEIDAINYYWPGPSPYWG